MDKNRTIQFCRRSETSGSDLFRSLQISPILVPVFAYERLILLDKIHSNFPTLVLLVQVLYAGYLMDQKTKFSLFHYSFRLETSSQPELGQ